jgi:RNA polymerase sigma-70 factor (ECF subfamily)
MDNGACSYRRFLDGDDEGFVEILRDYKDGLILYLTSIVGNIHIAEELAEDTFVLLGTKKPKDKGKGSFKTWLYTIGRNLATDTLRRRKDNVPLDEVAGVSESDDSVEEEYLRTERNASVRRCMDKLKAEHTQALWLVYFESFSYAEAARIMKKSPRQFDSLIYRARTSLKTELEKEGVTYDEL